MNNFSDSSDMGISDVSAHLILHDDLEVLRKLRAELAKKRPGELNGAIVFHRHNALEHSSRAAKEALTGF